MHFVFKQLVLIFIVPSYSCEYLLSTYTNSLSIAICLKLWLLLCRACIVGNLWDVTDREIDRFLESTLRQWFSDGSCDLVQATRAGRSACKLEFLTGAAPVVYGIPVTLAPVMP